MIVMKFGGTSVEDAAAMRALCRIVADRLDRRPLVVVSACAGVTTALLRAAHAAASGNGPEALAEMESLRGRHLAIADELLARSAAEMKNQIARQCDDLVHLLRSIAVIQEVTPRLLDQCAAYGEAWSSLLIAYALREQGIMAAMLDARSVIVTNDAFTKAEPQFAAVAERARDSVAPLFAAPGSVVVTQGFIGATEKGVTTTLGRGGSDYSAAIFGAALGAEEIQIWTDVDGILTADPRAIPDARLLAEVTFSEAAELAYFGAKVLHPSTILPAMKKNIPVRVLNSRRPEGSGTLILAHSGNRTGTPVRSIAFKRGITVITVESTRMLMAYGFLARVFEVFAQQRKSVDVVATSEVAVSLTLDDAAGLAELTGALSAFSDVSVAQGKAVVSVVGEGMGRSIGMPGRVFQALGTAGVRVELISHGGSEINITFVIDEADIARAVGSLHEEFFPPASGG